MGNSWTCFIDDFSFIWQRDTIIDIFFERHLGQLIEVITSSCPSENTAGESDKSIGSGRRAHCQCGTKPEILSNICELLCFCVLHHPYRIKYFLAALQWLVDFVLLSMKIMFMVFSLLFLGVTFFLIMCLKKYCYWHEEQKDT